MDTDPTQLAELRQFLAWSVQARKRFFEGRNRPDFPYLCMEDFVLQEGVPFRTVSPHQPATGKRINRYRPRVPRQCYDNAFKAATASRGQAALRRGLRPASEIFPVLSRLEHRPAGPHRGHDMVRHRTRITDLLRARPVGLAYLGVVFDLAYVRQTRTVRQHQHDRPLGRGLAATPAEVRQPLSERRWLHEEKLSISSTSRDRHRNLSSSSTSSWERTDASQGQTRPFRTSTSRFDGTRSLPLANPLVAIEAEATGPIQGRRHHLGGAGRPSAVVTVEFCLRGSGADPRLILSQQEDGSFEVITPPVYLPNPREF
jgi:hypothetical protein